ncbi:uncharacterized protein [Eurosta solidaginis]|uniref:uncharacterized protein n=1 Tax=Eurosta solidaginis TaxID=178769 RepID=UPI003530AC55
MKQWTQLERHTNISKKQFQTILEFCLRENNYFMYNSKLYQQTYGMPMGNPLSPTIADIVLDKILDDSIAELKKKDIYIKYINKYVDDVFAIIKSKDAEEILNTLNSQLTSIKFTIETEKDNKLAFLDVEVSRKNKNLLMNWYAKSIASGRIINYHSNHPWKQKINTTTNLIRKVILLSNEDFLTDNIKQIKKILFKNSYPSSLTDRLIQNTVNRVHQKDNNTQQDNTKKKYIGVNYIPGLTENEILHKTINNKNINYAHKPNNTLKKIFTRTKDPVTKEEQTDVVYKITCNGNENEKCNKCYIGTTKRQLGIRINEHKKDAENKKTSTGLAQHLTKSKHVADFSNVKILDIERREKTRMTLESIRIQQQLQNAMNFKEDFDNISSAYSAIIQRCKRM